MSGRRGSRRRGAVAGRCAAGALAVGLASAAASPAHADPEVDAPYELATGTIHTITGHGWPAGSRCTIRVTPTGTVDAVVTQDCTVDATGGLSQPVTVPVGTAPGNAYLIVSACPVAVLAAAEACSASTDVVLVAPPVRPAVALDPATGPAGSVVAVVATGFPPAYPCRISVGATTRECAIEETAAGPEVRDEVTVPAATPPGQLDVAVCTQCDGDAASSSAPFRVTPAGVAAGHDLGLTVDAASSDDGTIVVDATVGNAGQVDAPPAQLSASVAGWAASTVDLAPLEAGAERAVRLTLAVEGGPEPGTHAVAVALVQRRPDADPGNDVATAEVVVPAPSPPSSTPSVTTTGTTAGVPPTSGTGTTAPAPTQPRPPTTVLDGVDPDPIAADVPVAAVVLAVVVAAGVVSAAVWRRAPVRRRSLPAGAPPGTVPETVASSTGPRPPVTPATGRPVRLVVTTAGGTPVPHDPRRPLVAGRSYRLRVEAPPAPGASHGGALGALVFAAAGAAVERAPAEGPVDLDRPGGTGAAAFDFTVERGARRVALRCNLYRDGTLLQARLVSGSVRGRLPRRGGITSVVDYTSVPSLDEGRLAAVGRTDLSVLVNRARPGTMQVYAAGGETFAAATSLDAGAVADAVSLMRRALHTAAWGDDTDWTPDKADRYDPRVVDEGTRRERLRRDLVAMAKTGYDLYDAVIGPLAGGTADADRLTEMVRRPAYVEVAHKVSPRLVLPAALLYDHPLDAALPVDRYAVCPVFLADLDARRPLDGTACVDGRCPSHGDLETVCPSGFWGFRHFLGTPVSVADGPDAPAAIEYDGGPTLAVAVSTDLELRAGHEGALRALVPPERLRYADDRDAVFDVLGRGDAQVAYFYCHGGLAARGVPYIQVGPAGAPGITRSLLRARRLRWTDPRPLVVLNGCRTAALTPDRAIDLVSGFVDTAGAAGVMGTEVTVFEPLAGTFAVELLRRLLAGDELGRAVRDARLALLRGGNPLGLVYVSYAAPRLRLAARAPQAAGAAAVGAGGAG